MDYLHLRLLLHYWEVKNYWNSIIVLIDVGIRHLVKFLDLLLLRVKYLVNNMMILPIVDVEVVNVAVKE